MPPLFCSGIPDVGETTQQQGQGQDPHQAALWHDSHHVVGTSNAITVKAGSTGSAKQSSHRDTISEEICPWQSLPDRINPVEIACIARIFLLTTILS